MADLLTCDGGGGNNWRNPGHILVSMTELCLSLSQYEQLIINSLTPPFAKTSIHLSKNPLEYITSSPSGDNDAVAKLQAPYYFHIA